LSTVQIDTVKAMVDNLTNSTSDNVMKTLGLTTPPKDLQEFVSTGLNNKQITSDQITAIMQFARDAQKNYVISERMFSAAFRGPFLTSPLGANFDPQG
jgi:hypothetical protein